jgi:hypothetical protein
VGRVSTEARKRYAQKLLDFKSDIEKIQKREQQILNYIEQHPQEAGIRQLSLAHDSLNLVSFFLLMNELSVGLLGVKNEAYLNDARKGCYRSIIYLEKVVSSLVDAPFSDYEERLEPISALGADKRYYLIRKLGFAIQSVVEGYGDNTKWKWFFIEIDGRFAAVAKNMLDLKNLLSGLDPRAENYEARSAHLALVKKYLQKAADGYRQKYELSTLRADDFKLAIDFLSGLRRLHIILGEGDEVDNLKRKIGIWTTKMESDSRKKDQDAKASARRKVEGKRKK